MRGHVEEWLDVGEELHAPAALPYEITNVLARLVFKGALKINDVTEIWQDLAAFDLQLHPFDLTHDGPEVAAITAQLRRRHATDSTYAAWPDGSRQRCGRSMLPWPATPHRLNPTHRRPPTAARSAARTAPRRPALKRS